MRLPDWSIYGLKFSGDLQGLRASCFLLYAYIPYIKLFLIVKKKIPYPRSNFFLKISFTSISSIGLKIVTDFDKRFRFFNPLILVFFNIHIHTSLKYLTLIINQLYNIRDFLINTLFIYYLFLNFILFYFAYT